MDCDIQETYSNVTHGVSMQYDTKRPWRILFRIHGSIWCMVVPYCLLNCGLLIGVTLLKKSDINIYFSAKGHAIMSLIVSFLVVSKVNLAFDRYMEAARASWLAFLSLREVHQWAIFLTSTAAGTEKSKIPQWRHKTKTKLVELMDCTIRVVKNEKHAAQLARGEYPEYAHDDPMKLVAYLRRHLYHGSVAVMPEQQPLELLERMRLLDMLHEFTLQYSSLIKLASTPLPFALVQMGRTFLFLYVFSIPFVLSGIVGDDLVSGLLFAFFLTYGFMGLEFVSMKLLHPFADDESVNDLNLAGMRLAIVSQMEMDEREGMEQLLALKQDDSLTSMGSLDSTGICKGSQGSGRRGRYDTPTSSNVYHAMQDQSAAASHH